MWSIHAAAAALLFGTLAPAADAQTYGGSATGAAVTVPATGTVIRAASGTISISGGGAEASLPVGDIPGSATGGVVSLAAGTVHSAIVGIDATRGEASMGNVALTVSGNQISTDFLMARAAASCGPAAAASSELGSLVINGQAITVTGAANQTVALPNGTAIINKQTSTLNGTSAELVVDALYITTQDNITHQQLAEVVLATADSKIDCAGGAQANASFGTGGGWIPGADGGHATFGVVGGSDDGTPKSHVEFHDQNGHRMHSTTEFVDNSEPCVTTIFGSADITIQGVQSTGSYNIRIEDHGEPGKNRDFLTISFGVDYVNQGYLGGGNIQKHHETCTQ
jgi:hypothetical protein